MRLNRKLCGILVCVMGLSACASQMSTSNAPGAAQSALSFKAITASEQPLDVVKPMDAQRWRMPNGLSVGLIENDELPLVSGTLYIKGGALWEPENQIGTVSAMGDQMRQGGAGKRSADELDKELERLSAGVASGFVGEIGTVTFSCLASDIEEVFSIFADVVLRPRFEKDRLEVWRGQSLDAIKRRADDPETVAGLSMRELLFGDSVYGRVSTEADVKKITVAKLQASHSWLVRPGSSVLAVSGKISREKLEQLAQKYFGEWQGEVSPEILKAPEIHYQPKSTVYFIKQPLAQSTIFIGQQGVPRLTPDYLAIDAFNQMFGSGGFGALLTRHVRTELGLAYGIFGGIMPGLVKGKNLIVLQTKADSTARAISEAAKVLQQLKSTPVDAEQVDETKRGIRNSFVFNFDSADKVISRQAELEMLGYPKDYDLTYLPGMEAVTAEDIKAVAVRRWDYRQMVIVVVGNDTAYSQLQDLVKDPQGVFNGTEIKQVSFDQKLQVK